MSDRRIDADMEVWVRDDENAYWSMTCADVSASGNEYSIPLGDVCYTIENAAPGMGLLSPVDMLQAVEQISLACYDADEVLFFNNGSPVFNDDGRLIAVVFECPARPERLTVRTATN